MSAPPERWSWVDLRLAPAAATVWGTTLLAPLLPVPVLAGAVVAAVVTAIRVSRRSRSPAAVVLLAVLAALAVTSATAAVRETARAASPLAGLAEGRRTAELHLELDGDPTAVRGVGPPRVVVEATVTALDDGGTRIRLDDAVILFGPADEWRGLLPGQAVQVRAVVSPVAADEGLVARVSARSPPVLPGDPPWGQRAAGGLREGLRDAAVRVLGPQTGGLLPGLVVGDTQAMDPVFVEDFRRAGLAHLTAVSGLSVAPCVLKRSTQGHHRGQARHSSVLRRLALLGRSSRTSAAVPDGHHRPLRTRCHGGVGQGLHHRQAASPGRWERRL